MLYFINDYSEGAHPEVLKAINDSNFEQTVGYGCDDYCLNAKRIIQKRIGNRNADVHFLVGGTQVNMTFISFVLKDYQAVIACDEGHINVHETGAVESTGHKVLTRVNENGKLLPSHIQEIVDTHINEHQVQPKMVYISQTTELGTYYTLEELKAISKVCKKNDLYLFVDGARLGSALVLEDAPDMKDLAKYADAFYIGGTKMGALFGEALVITSKEIATDFRYQIKQKGAMFAKGRLLGVQFETLLNGDLYENIGRHENKQADKLRALFTAKGYKLYNPSYTNQVFVLMDDQTIARLQKEVGFETMGKVDDLTICRFVTSWYTKDGTINALETLL